MLVLVLLLAQFGLPLFTLAQGLPDLAYLLMASGVVALIWGVLRAVWAVSSMLPLRAPGSALRAM